MRYEAVIFDLGGTLVRNAGWHEYEDAALKIARHFSAPVDDFLKLWFTHNSGLGVGEYDTYADYTKYICSHFDLPTPDDKLAYATEILFKISKDLVDSHHDGALELVAWLKDSGYKVALISDCFHDIPRLFEASPFAPYFDTALFSCQERINKADITIFKRAVERLGVDPDTCVYVADGMRNELANAAGLGMRSIQVYIPEELDHNPTREDWHGDVVSSLHELKELLQ